MQVRFVRTFNSDLFFSILLVPHSINLAPDRLGMSLSDYWTMRVTSIHMRDKRNPEEEDAERVYLRGFWFYAARDFSGQPGNGTLAPR